jgi:hypothetical protein
MRAGKHERRSVWVDAGVTHKYETSTLGMSSGRWRQVAEGEMSSKRWG